MRKIGYIRVSSEGQNTARQKEQLQALNLDQIYEEKSLAQQWIELNIKKQD